MVLQGLHRRRLRPEATAVQAKPNLRAKIPRAGPERGVVGPECGLAGHQCAIDAHDQALAERLPVGTAAEGDLSEDPGSDRPRQSGEAEAPPAQPTLLWGQTTGDLLRCGPGRESLVSIGRMPGESANAPLDRRVAQAQSRQDRLADLNPKMSRIVVGRIVDGDETEALAEPRGLLAGEVEQGPKPGTIDRRHARKTVETSTAKQMHEHRLELIGGRMAEGDKQ